ncbi:MAG: hypothetical protein LBD80_02670 [Tannerella sp.]|jgi:hypothetical protein|nr:hypothetical protein [Tannerella sp.]
MGLFTPAWKGKNEEKALRSVEKITGRKKLAKVAKEAITWRARKAAVAKLTHQGLLLDIAMNESEYFVRKAAVANLTDQQSLACVAKNNSDSNIRRAAVAKLADQRALAFVAKNDGTNYVREAAVKNLADESLLADIAKNDSDWEVCHAAVVKLTDPEVLKDIAEKYIANIHALTGDCNKDEWQKVKTLISIAKKAPQLLKENWQQISKVINGLHEDIHSDDRSKGNWYSSRRHETAASKGLVFPPYPFDD